MRKIRNTLNIELTEHEIDSAFCETRTDMTYQRESLQLAAEFERSDWEAWQSEDHMPKIFP